MTIRPFDSSLPMALMRAREAAMRLFRPMLADHDLSEQQWRALRALDAADGPIDATTLADRTFLLGPSLSRILSNLEGRGLIERTASDRDQRRSLIVISRSGARVVADIGPRSEAIYAAIETEFGTDRLRRLLAELDELAGLELGGPAVLDLAGRADPVVGLEEAS